MKIKDISGQQFGRLTVEKYIGSNKGRNARWLCKCNCGRETIAVGYNLKSGDIQSCGCLRKEITAERGRAKSGGGIYFKKLDNRWMVNCRNKTTTPYARIVMEDFMGRDLNQRWVVHHEDEDSTNDELSNLAIFTTQSAHMVYHNKQKANGFSKGI